MPRFEWTKVRDKLGAAWTNFRETPPRQILVRIPRLVLRFLKGWGIFLVQGGIVLAGLIATGYVGGIANDSSRTVVVDAIIGLYFLTAKLLRKWRPKSKPVLEYARRAYQLTKWIIAVAAVALAPSVWVLIPFLGTLKGIVQNLELLIGILAFLTLLGAFTGLGDTFEEMEDEMVKKFEAEKIPLDGETAKKPSH